MRESPPRLRLLCVNEASRTSSCSLEVSSLWPSCLAWVSYRWRLSRCFLTVGQNEGGTDTAGSAVCLWLVGLKVLAQKFPEGMTTGTIPARCLLCPSNAGLPRQRSSRPVEKASHPAETKWRFTHEDLSKIQIHLEEMLISTDNGSE